MKKREIFLIVSLAVVSLCSGDESPSKLTSYSPADVASAIRSGKIGDDFAQRALSDAHLEVRERQENAIPFQVFWISDFQSGYSVLVESEGSFVVICKARGGGDAHGFVVKTEDGQSVLYYQYHEGSGLTYRYRARYIVGSRRPEVIEGPKLIRN